jgi:hypothetical protein
LRGAGNCRHGAYEDAEYQCKTGGFQLNLSLFSLVVSFSVAVLPVCHINYREQSFTSYDK